MVHFFTHNILNRLLLSSVLITFSMATLTPPPIYANIGINDIAFGIRIKKLVDNIWKYQARSDVNKLIDTMLDIKLEIENYTGHEYSLNKELDKVESELKKQGIKVSKNYMEGIRKAIKKKNKKHNHRALCLACYIQDNPSIPFEEYEMFHQAAKGHDKENDEQNLNEYPLRFTIGIVMMLTGGFLCVAGLGLKIPACVEMGKTVSATGLGLVIDGYVNIEEEKEKEKNK